MSLAPPHGGVLQRRYLDSAAAAAAKTRARDYPSWDLSLPQLGWLELLLSGALSPLAGYLGQADHRRVLAEGRLDDGTLWPLPLTLEVTADTAQLLALGAQLALRDPEGVLIAVLTVSEQWPDADNPDVVHLSGPVAGIEAPHHYDFPPLRLRPGQLRMADQAPLCGIAVSDPLTPAQHRHSLDVLRALQARPLLAVNVGTPMPDDRRHYARVRCQQGVLAHYPTGDLWPQLTLLPLPPAITAQELLLNTIVLQNYGCRYALLDAETVLDPAARKRLQSDCQELAIEPHFLAPPDDAAFSELAHDLAILHPSRRRQGLTVFFTGLSGSGKSTVANALLTRLLALDDTGERNITLLDGDRVRKHLSSELGFSKQHRNLNILRIGYVASQITKHGGIAICAPIAPYAATRQAVRDMIEAHGGFIEVHVATPLEECERRDRKGLYAKARAGLIKEFTGISDPYEAPSSPELTIDTTRFQPLEAADRVIARLRELGYL